MKKTILAALIIFLVISCNFIEKEERVLVKGKSDEVLVLNTPRAGCHKCQKIIEEGLQNIEGVSQSILNLNSKQISIVYSPENITPEILSSAVKELTIKTPCN